MLSAVPAFTPLPGVEPIAFRLDQIPVSSPVLAERRATIVPISSPDENFCRPTLQWQVRLPGGCRAFKSKREQGGFKITIERAF